MLSLLSSRAIAWQIRAAIYDRSVQTGVTWIRNVESANKPARFCQAPFDRYRADCASANDYAREFKCKLHNGAVLTVAAVWLCINSQSQLFSE